MSIMKVIRHVYFKKIRTSNVLKIMASLDDQKISLEPYLLTIFPYKSVSYDSENRSKCYQKTLKVVKIELKTALKTLKMVSKNG